MENEVKLAVGALVSLAVATAALVVLPYLQVRDVVPPEGLKAYDSAQLRGRAVYISNGCVYCHTQQPRDRHLGPDNERGWGRVSVPGDYYYDKPHLLGSMRTGPDLFNIGARQPSKDWQLGHLYQPRAYGGARFGQVPAGHGPHVSHFASAVTSRLTARRACASRASDRRCSRSFLKDFLQGLLR